MTRIGPFIISMMPEVGLVGLELAVDGGRTWAAALSPDEVEKLIGVLRQVWGHLERAESARADLRAVMAEVLGRDPFEGG